MNFHWRSLWEESQKTNVSENRMSRCWEKQWRALAGFQSCGDSSPHFQKTLQWSLQRTNGSVRLDGPLPATDHMEALIQGWRSVLHGWTSKVLPGFTSSWLRVNAFISIISISLWRIFPLKRFPWQHFRSPQYSPCAGIQEMHCVFPLWNHM